MRTYTAEDAEAAFKNWASNDNVTKYLNRKTHSDIAETREYIGTLLKNEKEHHYTWVIELKSTGELIGEIGTINAFHRRIAEIGFCIGEAWQRQGYASEALAAVMRFFFTENHANRVWGCHDVKNPNAGKVMLKCGLKYEATARQAARNNTGVCDIAVYGIIAEDFFDLS